MSRGGPDGRPFDERHEDHLVAAQRAAVPGAVLADDHAVRKAGQGAGGKPAQAERGGVAAQREIRGDRGRDPGRVLRHAVVDDPVPVAIGPAVEAAVAHRGQIVGRRLVAQRVALVDHRPQGTRRRLPRHADGIAQAGGEDAGLAALEVELVDGGAAFLCRHAAVADIGQRADADIELPPVGAQKAGFASSARRPSDHSACGPWRVMRVSPAL